ncbi:MAG: hypothetical protein J5959_02500 [Butyrivibrio sp.]|nr:hypothetical protein [Butyrivibrio sp.]MBP3240172.1 hypothetical protein [Oribacterium sp.]
MSEDLLQNLEYLDDKIDEMGCLRANLDIIAIALEGDICMSTAGYAVESCAKTFLRLWNDMNTRITEMIDHERKQRIEAGTLEEES